MIKKYGINTTRARKSGPTVKNAMEQDDGHVKIVRCSCGANLEKRCKNAYICDISVMTCPRCGAKVS